ncbi:MAG: hypothetical protein GX488_02670, partial [Clostridiales bacterium]|nr:hypothetical protein [Clostridiales bacterium]
MTYDGTVPQIEDSELPLYGENIARTLIVSGSVRGMSIAKQITGNIKHLREIHT